MLFKVTKLSTYFGKGKIPKKNGGASKLFPSGVYKGN